MRESVRYIEYRAAALYEKRLCLKILDQNWFTPIFYGGHYCLSGQCHCLSGWRHCLSAGCVRLLGEIKAISDKLSWNGGWG